MVDPEILAYYEHNGERDRLDSGGRRIEFLRVWDLLKRFLPSPPATVLDVGGGAGRYAIPLAARGYDVHLVDPVPLLVSQAAEAARAATVSLASASVGDARSLAASDASADAVLLLGPLYHLTSRDDRIAALAEARRVARPGGVVVALGLSRFYPLFEELAAGGRPDRQRILPVFSPTASTVTRPGTSPRSRRPTSTVPRTWLPRSPTRDCGLARSSARTGS